MFSLFGLDLTTLIVIVIAAFLLIPRLREQAAAAVGTTPNGEDVLTSFEALERKAAGRELETRIGQAGAYRRLEVIASGIADPSSPPPAPAAPPAPAKTSTRSTRSTAAKKTPAKK